jgi:hypothetical protein
VRVLRVCVRAHGRTRKESKESKESRTHTHAVTPLPALDALDVTDFNAEGTDCSGVGEAHAFGLGSPHASHVLERRVLERGELFAHLRAVAASCQDDTRIICKATVISDAFLSLAAGAASNDSSSAPKPADDDVSPGGGSYMKPSAPPCGPDTPPTECQG